LWSSRRNLEILLREPLGASGKPLGASGSLWEPLGASGKPLGAIGSLWEPLGSLWEPPAGSLYPCKLCLARGFEGSGQTCDFEILVFYEGSAPFWKV
jgi:hypothetical protein